MPIGDERASFLLGAPPTPPETVTVKSDLSQERLVVSWVAVPGAIAYNVYRGLSQNLDDQRLVSVAEVTVMAEALVRGPEKHGAEPLSAQDVFSILRVYLNGPGSVIVTDEDFIDGVDVVLIGNTVDWRTRNRQPVAGQTYFVDYVRRDPAPIAATVFIDPHANVRIRTNYWYSIQSVFPNGVLSAKSTPVTVIFNATDRHTREFNKTMERF